MQVIFVCLSPNQRMESVAYNSVERVDLARLVEQTQQVAKISEQMREEELRIICKPQYLMRHLGGNAEALEDIEYFTPTHL
jgi:hypothetical protein